MQLRLIHPVPLQSNPSNSLRTLGPIATMVAKGKGRASRQPSASGTQSGSGEGIVPATLPTATLEDLTTSDDESHTEEQLQELRKRAAQKEEYITLMRKIRDLEVEQESFSSHPPRLQSTVAPIPASRGPRFDRHSVEYKGKNLQELRQWIRALEDDHENFPDTFTSDQKRVFYASKALKPESQAYKHWVAKREQIDSLEDISYHDFLEVLYDALGSKEARMAQAYYDHMEAKWDPKQSIVEFHRKLKSYEETFVNPIDDHYLYYQLWRQIPDEFRVKLIGTNKPKTRDEIVRAIEELEIDRKRDRSKSDAAAQSENKRHKTYEKRNHAPRTHETNAKTGTNFSGNRATKGPVNPIPTCNFCKKLGHVEADCFTKKNRESRAQANPTNIAAVTTTSDKSGKDKALLAQAQGQRRKD